MLTDPRSPFFQLAADLSRAAHGAAMQQPPALVVPEAEKGPQRVTAAQYARAEAASAVLKAAARWADYMGGDHEGTADHHRDALRLVDVVANYGRLTLLEDTDA